MAELHCLHIHINFPSITRGEMLSTCLVGGKESCLHRVYQDSAHNTTNVYKDYLRKDANSRSNSI